VRARRGNPEAVLGREAHDVPSQADQLGPHFGRRPAHRGADLHDRLMQLGLHLGQDQMISARSSVIYDLSSRVVGSMIWYSSSMRA